MDIIKKYLGIDVLSYKQNKTHLKTVAYEDLQRGWEIIDICRRSESYKFIIDNLSHERVRKKDYFFGKTKGEFPFKSPAFCFCYNRKVARELKDVYLLAEIINRIRDKTKKLKVYKEKESESIVRKATQESNSMFAEIIEGISRILNRGKQKGDKVIENIIDFGNYKVYSLHGHEFRKFKRENKYINLKTKIDAIFFGHYHRLFAFDVFNILAVCSGSLKKIKDEKNYLLPGLGFTTIIEGKNFSFPRFTLFRF